MSTDIISDRGFHEDCKESTLIKNKIQEENDEIVADLKRDLNDNGSPKKVYLEKEDETDLDTETEENHSSILDDDNQTYSNQELSQHQRLASSQEPGNILSQSIKDYRRNFNGFVKIVPFDSINTMHEYIRENIKDVRRDNCVNKKQKRYLEILLRVEPEKRFKELLEFSDYIVRQILLANRGILEGLIKNASIENLPCPIATECKDFEVLENTDDDEDIEANIEPWYIIELIGLWLNFINDLQSFRDELRWELLRERLGGIPVPLASCINEIF